MKRQRIGIDQPGRLARGTLHNASYLEQWDESRQENVVEYAGNPWRGIRRIPLIKAQKRLARLLGNHWPGTRSYRVNRLAFKLQRALKYLLFNIRHGLTKRLDWYGERLNALQTNETLGDL